MKTFTLSLLVGFCLFGFTSCSKSPAPEQEAKNVPTIEFQGVTYFHRWAGGIQHEFTPKGQEDLDKWTDMVTVLYHKGINDEDRLAELAKTIVDLDKKGEAALIKVGSTSGAEGKPVEHLIIAVFSQPDFKEAAFTRILLREGEGLSFIYAHRIYGKDIDAEMKAWGKANGQQIEEAVMNFQDIPKAEQLPDQ